MKSLFEGYTSEEMQALATAAGVDLQKDTIKSSNAKIRKYLGIKVVVIRKRQ